MKANVYALFEVRQTAFDMYMVCGSQQEAIDYYKKMTGKPGVITDRVYDDSHEQLLLDQDEHGGAGYVVQYKVGIEDIIEE